MPADSLGKAARGRSDRLLTVNADDFAWSKSVNSGIIETHRDGIVTSTSILAAGSAFQHAVELALDTPTLAVGMHLNIFRGFTVLPASEVPTLCDDDGRLLGSWKSVVSRLATGRMDEAQIEAELRAQIEKVVAAGISPAHFDSEKHLHLWPSVFRIVCRLAREFGVNRVRVVREPRGWQAIPQALALLSASDARYARELGIVTSDATIGVAESPVDVAALERLLAHPEGRDVELVVHPGHLDEEFWELQATIANRLTDSREKELEVLVSPQAKALVERYGFTLAAQ
jgi:predicted glycoside hydrolase/deacetylase ChbG (UPF0249 family)